MPAALEMFGVHEVGDRIPASIAHFRWHFSRLAAGPEVTYDIPSVEDVEAVLAIVAEEAAASALADATRRDAEVTFAPLPEEEADALLLELAWWEESSARWAPDLTVELTYRGEPNFYSDLAGEELGLFIPTFVAHVPGDALVVCFSLPELEDSVVSRGVVRWTRDFFGGEASPGLGVALEGLAEDVRCAIASFMGVRAPLLHDV